MADRLFGGKATNLKAITINGAVHVSVWHDYVPGLFFQRFSSAPCAKMRRKIEFNKKFLEFSEKSIYILSKNP